MTNNVFRKGLVIAIIVCFIGAGVFPSISANIVGNKEIGTIMITGESYDTSVVSSTNVDWWPMFHHDLSNSGYSTSAGPDTNAILWSYTTGGRVDSPPAVSDGKVYFGSNDYNVYCLDADTGNKIWSFKTGSVVWSSPAVSDGRVYFGSYDDKVYCLDADNGNKIWSFKTGSDVTSSPAVSDGKVYIGSYDDKVYCLDADNGNEIWNYNTGSYVLSSPAVSDGKVYISAWEGGYDQHNVHCLDADNGNKIWSFDTGYWMASSPAVSDGKVYFGSWDLNVYCLDADNGNKIWSYDTGNFVDSSPAVSDGKVYFGTWGEQNFDDHNVYCLDADNGNKIWSFKTGEWPSIGRVDSSPAVADGKVYFGSLDHNVYCLDADNGNKIWSYETGDCVWGSSPAVSDGKVYIGSYDRKVYCFSDSGTHPPNKPTISGPTSGKSRIEYTYIANATDSEGDRIKYLFDWGDGTSTWTDYHASGEPVEASHKWILQGNYEIKVRAKEDTFGYESEWSDPLSVTMLRNRAIDRPFFNFLKNYPNMFPILRRLLLLIN